MRDAPPPDMPSPDMPPPDMPPPETPPTDTPTEIRFRQGPAGWLTRLIARPAFQAWAGRFPLTRGIARRDGAALFDIVQGFVQSQVLSALVEVDLLAPLAQQGASFPADLASGTGITPERMEILLQAGAALGLLKRHRGGRFSLARRGAAVLGVPGLQAMIRHHAAFYADMADPVALLRGRVDTGLSRFWPYVLGDGVAPETAARYSDLMAQSLQLVAQDALRMVPLTGVGRLLDVGGGSGAFLRAVAVRYPGMDLMLFDLPQVIGAADGWLECGGLSRRVTLHAGSFRDDPLPRGADAVSLVRVLYDHDDRTVRALLRKVHDALPPGGHLLVVEPMAGGARPERAGDVYFAFYTMAMGTGRARSATRIAELCREAGFDDVRTPRAPRPYVTSALLCTRPAGRV